MMNWFKRKKPKMDTIHIASIEPCFFCYRHCVLESNKFYEQVVCNNCGYKGIQDMKGDAIVLHNAFAKKLKG